MFLRYTLRLGIIILNTDEGCRRGEVFFRAAFVSSGPALSAVAEQDSTTCEPRRRRGGAGGGGVEGNPEKQQQQMKAGLQQIDLILVMNVETLSACCGEMKVEIKQKTNNF